MSRQESKDQESFTGSLKVKPSPAHTAKALPGSPSSGSNVNPATNANDHPMLLGVNEAADSKAASAKKKTPHAIEFGSPGVSVKADRASEGEAKATSFPERLMGLIQKEVATDAIWWLPGGDAFALSPELFPEKVLQKFFQGTKFESFTRKLNRW